MDHGNTCQDITGIKYVKMFQIITQASNWDGLDNSHASQNVFDFASKSNMSKHNTHWRELQIDCDILIPPRIPLQPPGFSDD